MVGDAAAAETMTVGTTTLSPCYYDGATPSTLVSRPRIADGI
jgi:hypothetical protein